MIPVDCIHTPNCAVVGIRRASRQTCLHNPYMSSLYLAPVVKPVKPLLELPSIAVGARFSLLLSTRYGVHDSLLQASISALVSFLHHFWVLLTRHASRLAHTIDNGFPPPRAAASLYGQVPLNQTVMDQLTVFKLAHPMACLQLLVISAPAFLCFVFRAGDQSTPRPFVWHLWRRNKGQL